MNEDVLTGIGELIDNLYKCADEINKRLSDEEESSYVLLLKAATTIDILAERIIDSENTSALRVYSLEQQLLTKQAYIDYLKLRLDDFDIGYQQE